MSTTSDPTVTSQLHDDYWRDGAVCVRGAFSSDEIELARRAIDANLADLSPFAKRASDSADGACIEDFCNWQRIPELEQFVRTSAAPRIAADLIGRGPVRLYHDHVLVKEPAPDSARRGTRTSRTTTSPGG